MNLSKTASFMAALVAGGCLFVTLPAQATLIGDTINGSPGAPFGPTPASATIGAGVEFTGIFGGVNFDFGASTLTLSSPGIGASGFPDYVFSGFDEVITNVSLASNSGATGCFLTTFSFTSNSITLCMGLIGFSAGDVVVFDIATSAVTATPEPATLALFGAGLAGLGAMRRRKAKA